MADSTVVITVQVKNRVDLSAGKYVEEETNYTFNDVIDDVRLLEILEAVTPRTESVPA